MRVVSVPFVDPVAAFAPFAAEDWAMLLDSAGSGRHAIIAARPAHTVASRGGAVLVDGRPVEGDPFTVLAGLLATLPPASPPPPLPFAGGLLGLFGYELGRYLERAPGRAATDGTELAVGLYDAVAVFDLAAARAWVVAARPEAAAKAEDLARLLAATRPLPPPAPLPPMRPRPDLDSDSYLGRIARVIAYIRAGDVFQVNLTQRFAARRPAGLVPFDLYRHLRAANPAPFAAFLQCGGGLAVASASPERFVAVDRAGRIETRPIKGTRRRAADAAADAALAAELVACGKDRAENLMITDLLRNDIGRVAAIGSVAVPVLCGLESFATLHHLVSVVTGRLRPGLEPLDLLRACFPGGSITGAPKVRAMEIIDELEPAPRGAYCGAIGWIGADGAMDTSIVIRAVTITAGQVVVQAGGGIVAESDPAAELAEMLAKAAPALGVLRGEEGE